MYCSSWQVNKSENSLLVNFKIFNNGYLFFSALILQCLSPLALDSQTSDVFSSLNNCTGTPTQLLLRHFCVVTWITMFLISATETVLREKPIGHTSSGGFVKSLYIMLNMDYNHKMWTVVVLLRDDSVGHSPSGSVVTTWSRLSEIFMYLAKNGLRLSNMNSWYASWRGDHKVFLNRCLRSHCCAIKWFLQMPLHSVLR